MVYIEERSDHFYGHFFPGTFFIVAGLYWSYHTIKSYCQFITKKRNDLNSEFTCKAVYYDLKFFNIPLEPLFKIICPLTLTSGELINGNVFKPETFPMENLQHIAMESAFILSGIFDILFYFEIPLPKNLDFAMLAFAFFVEALTFSMHLHGRTQLDMVMHKLFILTVIMCFVACLVEMRFRHQPLSTFLRCTVTIAQGTWFYQMAFLVYNPFVKELTIFNLSDHKQILYIVAVFVFHLILIILSQLLFALAYSYFSGKFSFNSLFAENNEIRYSFIKKNDGEHEIV